jgi:nucleoid DNA-binding protein
MSNQKNTANTGKAAPKPLTKSELRQRIAEETGLSAKQVGQVLDSLGNTCGKELNRKGVGVFTVPGLVKIKKVIKPATKEKKMISPFTKLEITVKAKPARNVIKVRPLKGLKDSIA